MTDRLERATKALATVVDPEIPALTIQDMGILRGTEETPTGVRVTITPTYSGCPAMSQIHDDITAALVAADVGEIDIDTVYSPAWSSEWMTREARAKLEGCGIAAPTPISDAICPLCRQGEARLVSEFGSTACKALLVCSACGEPFDLFKEI